VVFSAPFTNGISMTPGTSMGGKVRLGKYTLFELSEMDFDVKKSGGAYVIYDGR
jgi:hypothetical protein